MNFSQIKKINWQKIEDNRKISLYPVMVPGWTTIIQNSGKIIGKAQNSILCLHQGHIGTIYGNHNEWDALGKYILKKLQVNLAWGFFVNNKIIALSHELVAFSGKLQKRNFSGDTTLELIRRYEQYEGYHGRLYHYAIIPVFLDLYQPLLSDYLMAYLKKNAGKVGSSEAFGILTTPDKASKVRIEEISLMAIAREIKGDKKLSLIFKKTPAAIEKVLFNFRNNKLQKKIIAHQKLYGYQGYNWEGPGFSLQYFLRRIKFFLKQPNLPGDLAEAKNYYKRIREQKKHYRSLAGIDKKHAKLFDLTCEFIYGKDFRKDCLVKSYWHLEPLLAELARRLGLTFRQVRSLTPKELKELAKGRNLTKEQASRVNLAVYVVLSGKTPGKIFTGKEAQAIADYFKKREKVTALKQVSGQVAYPGKAKGRVVIVEHPKDILQMKKGNIMISHMTNPDLVSGMKIAGAIVTETGGITCHAAIVSRELKIPCVIGTKIATRVFTDGDLVEVDATKGVVRKVE